MNKPMEILVALNDLTQELDERQHWVNRARNESPSNQLVQLSLDREQSDINLKRDFVQIVMADISSRN
jgi:hypothetical protein